jgi:hypothetical protein
MIEAIFDCVNNLTGRQYLAWSAALAIFVGSCWGVLSYVSVRNDGIDQELGLVFQWNTMEARYSQGRATIIDGLQIANDKKEALNQLLKTAIESRSGRGALDRRQFLSVVKEAYPDLTQLKIFDKLANQVQAMRKAFALDQTKLHDQVRAYDKWRTTGGLFHPWLVRRFGFPSDQLEIHIGQTVLKGQQALDKISQAIISAESSDIFTSGHDRQLQKSE